MFESIDWLRTAGLIGCIYLGLGLLVLLAITWRGVLMPVENREDSSIWECLVAVVLVILLWPIALQAEAVDDRVARRAS